MHALFCARALGTDHLFCVVFLKLKQTCHSPSAAESSFSALSGTSSANAADAIRNSSNRLASLSATFSTRPRRVSNSASNAQPPQFEHRNSVPHPKQPQNQSVTSPGSRPQSQTRQSIDNNAYRPIQPSHLQNSSLLPDSREISPGSSQIPSSVGHVGPSGLSVMLERDEERRRQQSQLDLVKAGQGSPDETDNEATPVPRHARLASSSHNSESTERPSPNLSKDHLPITVEGEVSMGDEDEAHASSALRRYLADGADLERADEETPLLASGHKVGPTDGKGLVATVSDWKQQAGKLTMRDVARGAFEPVTLLPATILGLLLNVLDGVSYGMIL